MRHNCIITLEIGECVTVYTGVPGHLFSSDDGEATHMTRVHARRVREDIGRVCNAEALHIVEVVR